MISSSVCVLFADRTSVLRNIWRHFFLSSCFNETERATVNFCVISAPFKEVTERVESISTEWVLTWSHLGRVKVKCASQRGRCIYTLSAFG